MESRKRLHSGLFKIELCSVSSYLDNDLWFDILKRLPPKTIICCRCVCKSWYSLVTTELFMKEHFALQLKNAEDTNGDNLLFSKRGGGDTFSPLNSNTITPIFPNIPCPILSKNSPTFRVVGSIHGLICIMDHHLYDVSKATVLVWNPSVSRYICISQPPTNLNPVESTRINHFSYLRFTYNPINKEYFLVRLMCMHDVDDIMFIEPIVDLYSLSTHEWRSVSNSEIIEGSYIKDEVSCSQYKSSTDGSVCWIAKSHQGVYLVLLSIAENELKSVTLPENLKPLLGFGRLRVGPKRLSVVEYKGLLSVLEVTNIIKDIEWSFNIWSCVNNKDEWSKMYSINMDIKGLKMKKSTKLVFISPVGKDKYIIGSKCRGKIELIMFHPEKNEATALRSVSKSVSMSVIVLTWKAFSSLMKILGHSPMIQQANLASSLYKAGE